jgi:AcrR family transcriptional regulator
MPASSTAAPRQRGGKGLQRRAEIIEAARQRLIEKGTEGLVLRDISSELGITHGNLQYYFATKNDLLKAIFDEEVQEYTSALNESMASSSDASDIVSEIVDSNLEVLGRPETRIWRILWSMADQDADLAEILKQENEFFEATLRAKLEVVAPHLSKERLDTIAKLTRFIMDGIGVHFIFTDPQSPAAKALAEPVKRTIRQLLSL